MRVPGDAEVWLYLGDGCPVESVEKGTGFEDMNTV